jgi:hypothetical protein
MASLVKYEKFVEDMWNKIHDLFGTTDTVKCVLTNSAPNVATHTVLADVTQISGGTGYTTGGEDAQNDSTRTGGTVTLTCVDITWTASGSMGPFRYVPMYNDTPTSPADPLMHYWDYGSPLTLAIGETFTIDFGASTHTVT